MVQAARSSLAAELGSGSALGLRNSDEEGSSRTNQGGFSEVSQPAVGSFLGINKSEPGRAENMIAGMRQQAALVAQSRLDIPIRTKTRQRQGLCHQLCAVLGPLSTEVSISGLSQGHC